MQGIMETIFDILYLGTVITLGVTMLRRSPKGSQFWLFGLMAVILGSGDAFHLVPRSYALLTTGLQNNVAALGIGKLITSITMTVFYLILYRVWRMRYEVKGNRGLDLAMILLGVVRVALCLFPQNGWTSPDAPLSWGIWRNIPFALMGLIVIVLFYKSAREKNDHAFRHMYLTITLSFLFYIPVVLWADTLPLVGILMIPKTMAYVWTVAIGYLAMRKEQRT